VRRPELSSYEDRGWGVAPLEPRRVTSPTDLYFESKRIDNDGSDWTYSLFSNRALCFHARPLRVAYEVIQTWDQLVSVLRVQNAMGQVHATGTVSVTLELFAGVFDVSGGVLAIPGKADHKVGKHVVAIESLDRRRKGVVFRNSWGETWGNRGRGLLRCEYFDRYCTEAWLSRDNAASIPPRFLGVPFLRGSDAFLAAAAAPTPANQIWTNDDPSGQLRSIRAWQADSVVEAGTLHVLEAVGPKRIKIGWATLLEPSSVSQMPIVTEFYVWPTYRRLGVARIMRAELDRMTASTEPTGYRVLIHQADISAAAMGGTGAYSPLQAVKALGLQFRASRRVRPAISTPSRTRTGDLLRERQAS
jgi:hypothetical protein